jgi:hypothetical protein
MNRHTIVSWTKFCEWVQGKKVLSERDASRSTEVKFEDGTEAVFYSECDRKFGEIAVMPPMVSIKEKSP